MGYDIHDYLDDFGPPDSPPGDSESDHVWADLARSEAEPPPESAECSASPDGYHSFATPEADFCEHCGS